MPDNSTQIILDRIEGMDDNVKTLIGQMGGVEATLVGHGREIGKMTECFNKVDIRVTTLENRTLKNPMTSYPPSSSRNGNNWVKPFIPYILIGLAVLGSWAMNLRSASSSDVDKLAASLAAVAKVTGEVQRLQKQVDYRSDEAKKVRNDREIYQPDPQMAAPPQETP